VGTAPWGSCESTHTGGLVKVARNETKCSAASVRQVWHEYRAMIFLFARAHLA
jgi:hypothetical protein